MYSYFHPIPYKAIDKPQCMYIHTRVTGPSLLTLDIDRGAFFPVWWVRKLQLNNKGNKTCSDIWTQCRVHYTVCTYIVNVVQ